eukprot:3381727-Amphidinium_carterae.1
MKALRSHPRCDAVCVWSDSGEYQLTIPEKQPTKLVETEQTTEMEKDLLDKHPFHKEGVNPSVSATSDASLYEKGRV